MDQKNIKKFLKFWEEIFDQSLSDIAETGAELKETIRELMETNPEINYSNLATKLGNLRKDSEILVGDMASLIVNIQKDNPIQLTEEELQRIKQEERTQKMFTDFFPYFVAYNQRFHSEFPINPCHDEFYPPSKI